MEQPAPTPSPERGEFRFDARGSAFSWHTPMVMLTIGVIAALIHVNRDTSRHDVGPRAVPEARVVITPKPVNTPPSSS